MFAYNPARTAWLKEVHSKLQAKEALEPISVRQLLRRFGVVRRGRWIVEDIDEEFAKHGITTEPHIGETWYDAPVEFMLAEPIKSTFLKVADGAAPAARHEPAVSPRVEDEPMQEIGMRVGALKTARCGVISVSPTDTLAKAESLMHLNDYSQLPVLTTERTLKGVVSWRTIGHTRLEGRSGAEVREFMEASVPVVNVRQSVLDIVGDIIRHGFVFVRDEHERVTGIVSATDVSHEFLVRLEPFELLGDIENSVRRLIAPHFTTEELTAARAPSDTLRKVEDVHDLSFGEYIRLLEVPDHWARLGLSVDKASFVAMLGEVRDARNDVMHFSPDPLEAATLRKLRAFSRSLQSMLRRH
ncbi:MAG: CBS domain-containing protein [Planctomycetes bacterium]|nr:CBS domain-containing protein [Planctomycetota bacterium]